MMTTTEHRKGSPISASLRERLEQHDHLVVLRASGMSAAAYWRARGGGPVHVGTMLRLVRTLDDLEAERECAR
jgi:hypothetical protein